METIFRVTPKVIDKLERIYRECERQTGSLNGFLIGKKKYTICAGCAEKFRSGGGMELTIEDTDEKGNCRAVGSFIILPCGSIPFGPFSKL